MRALKDAKKQNLLSDEKYKRYSMNNLDELKDSFSTILDLDKIKETKVMVPTKTEQPHENLDRGTSSIY